MRSVGTMTAIALVGISMAVGTAEPLTFTKGPTAARVGDTVRIEFAVDRATDVAVTVEDANGRVVRHLVAGVLGTNPPAPLKPDTLTQTIVWDGTNDSGERVLTDGATFRVKVQAGMKPTFDSFMLFNPDATPMVRSLAVGPKGNVYIFYHDATANGNQGGVKARILDRNGRHVRQIVPFPADLPYARVRATGAFRDEDGHLVPHCHNWHSLNFYPDTVLARGRSMSQFSMPVVDANGRIYWIISGGRLCAVDADGGIPYDTFLSPPLFPDLKYPGGRPALALSGDGKSIYVGGIYDGRYSNAKPVPCVYRIEIATRRCEVFLGNPEQSGTKQGLFSAPRGVAVVNGLLYVADPTAGRIAAFKESDKSYVGEMKVTLPHIVQVHPRTGAVYVCSYVPEKKPRADGKTRIKDANLLKFARFGDSEPVYQMALPKTGLSPNDSTHRIVLDPTADPPLLWAPGLAYARRGRRIACYRDTGTAFEPVEIQASNAPWGVGPRDMLVDRKRGDLYVKVSGEQWYQFDEPTGTLKRLVKFPKNDGAPYYGAHGANLGVDSAGNYITHCWGTGRGMMRWTRDLKPLKWEGMDTHRTEWGGMMTFQLNYLTMRNDDIYLIKRRKGPHHLDILDLGLKEKRRVVWNVRRGSCPRVDAKGNVYVTVPLRAAGRDFPEFFDGKLDNVPTYFRTIGEGNYWYTYMYGAIVKFPPAGGAFHWIETDRMKNDLTGLPDAVQAKPKVKYQYFQGGRYPHKLCEVQGAEWVRTGYAPYSETYSAGTPVCMCEGAGFDVDAHGRVFYTNLCQFRVEVIDTSNNPITTFGTYGNADSRPDGPVKTPAIPLAWPTYVAVSDTHAYVNDTISLRVVRVRLGSQAEAVCPVE